MHDRMGSWRITLTLVCTAIHHPVTSGMLLSTVYMITGVLTRMTYLLTIVIADPHGELQWLRLATLCVIPYIYGKEAFPFLKNCHC